MNLPDEKREAVVTVLGEHQRTLDGPGSCRCGEWPPPANDMPWPDHLADALAPLLAEWLECQYDLGLEDGVAVGEARVRARVEALCGCDSTGCPCGGDRASVPTRELRAALDADTTAEANPR